LDSRINRKSLFFQTLWKNLNQHIDILVLRNYENFPLDLGNDIDFLIRKNSIKKVEEIINDTCNMLEFSLHNKSKCYGYFGFTISDNLNINNLIKVDFFTTLSKGWMDYAHTEEILSNKIHFKEYFVPLLEHEAYLIFMKEFFMYGYLRDKYHDKFMNKYANVHMDEFYKLSRGLILYSSISSIVDEYHNIHKLKIIVKPTLLNIFKLKIFLKWLILDVKFKINDKKEINELL